MRLRSSPRFEVLAGLILVLLALWAAIGVLLSDAGRHARETAGAAQRNVARSLSEYEASSIRAIDISLRHLRDDWMRDARAFDESVARLEQYLAKERVIQVAVVDAEGWLLYSRLPQTGRPNFSDRKYFRILKEGGRDQLVISEPVFGRVTGQWAIQLTRPILRDGAFAGLIVVAVPPPALERVYSEIRLGPHGSVSLARVDGTVLAHAGDRTDEVLRALELPEGAAPAGELRVASPEGVDRIFSYRKLDDYPLAVFIGQDVGTMLAPYYRQRDVLAWGGALASMLLIALALALLARERERAKRIDERERLMLELHDGCIQSIYAIGLSLEQSRRMLAKDPARAAHAIADAGANLNLVIQDLRSFISGEVRAAHTEEEFIAEIQRMVPEPGAGVPAFTLDIDGDAVRRLTAEQAAHVLRIAREAISNVLRHAGARQARLTLARHGEEVRLEVVDDGGGVDGKPGGIGLGLPHIQARARKLRGRASIDGAPNRGTRVAVEFRAGA
jgi:signal transduction histidine kinase